MCNRVNKCLSILLLVLLVFFVPHVTYAAEEKTPAPDSVWINGGGISWDVVSEQYYSSDVKFRIYYKDKWSGESYKLVATRKGYDSENASSLHSAFYFRDATNEKDPQIIKEKKNGYIYYSIPAVSGHKYKVAVKAYDEKYGLWSGITTAEYYHLTAPEVTVEQTKEGLSFSWKPVPGATKYLVQRNKLSGETERELFKLVGNDKVNFLDKGVVDGKVYLYYIYAARGKYVAGTQLELIRVNLPK